ncbi:hypothetical protein ARSEF1564_000140 [Beauveria bassiana]
MLRRHRVEYNGRLIITVLGDHGSNTSRYRVNAIDAGISNGCRSHGDAAAQNIHHLPALDPLVLRSLTCKLAFNDRDDNINTALGPPISN